MRRRAVDLEQKCEEAKYEAFALWLAQETPPGQARGELAHVEAAQSWCYVETLEGQ